MPSATFTAQEFQRELQNAGGWEIGVTTYKLRGRWICKVDNVSPGATIARAHDESRDVALQRALDKAIERLATTRRHPK